METIPPTKTRLRSGSIATRRPVALATLLVSPVVPAVSFGSAGCAPGAASARRRGVNALNAMANLAPLAGSCESWTLRRLRNKLEALQHRPEELNGSGGEAILC